MIRLHSQQGPVSITSGPAPAVQRKCACGGAHAADGCEACRQRRGVPPVVQDLLRSPGQGLESDSRAFMEPRFGHDFSQVRVHTGPQAAAAARAVDALAFTVGRHIVFGEGRYRPATTDGRRLLAHELTHTLQQGDTSGLQRATADAAAGEVDELEEQGDAIGLAVLAESSAESDEGSGELLAAADTKSKAAPGKRTAKPKKPAPPPNPCTRTILAEGSCADLVAGSKWRCCDPENGLENPKRDQDIEGKECPSHKFTPQFTCDKECDKALAKGCADNDNWMAIPGDLKSVFRRCGQVFTICANGKQAQAYVRDRSVTKKSYEVSPGILSTLGVPLGSSFKGAVYAPGANQKKIDSDRCCKT